MSSVSDNYNLEGQNPLDKKIVSSSKNSLLAEINSNEFIYYNFYSNMKIFFQKENEEWIWVEINNDLKDVETLLNSNYIYPSGTIAYGYDYSGKSFNFIKYSDFHRIYVDSISSINNSGQGIEVMFKDGKNIIMKSLIADPEISILNSSNNKSIEFKLKPFARSFNFDGNFLKLKDQKANVLSANELKIENIKNLQNTLDQLSLGIIGVLKIETPAPSIIGLYKLPDIGTYTNLIPIIPYGSKIPTNNPITTETGFDNMVFWDGTNFTQLKTKLSYNIDVEGGSLSYNKGFENIRDTMNAVSINRKDATIVKFNQGNFYIDYGGNLQPNPDTVLSEVYNCENYRYLLTNLVITNNGFIVFKDVNNTIIKRVHVQQSELGNIVIIPARAKTVQLCAYINNPVYGDSPTAVLYSESLNNSDFSEKQIEMSLKSVFKEVEIIYFDRDKNVYIGFEGEENDSVDCIATDFIDCSNSKYLITYFNIYNNGFIVFYEENHKKIIAYQVLKGEEFKRIRVPFNSKYVKLSCFDYGDFSNIENPFAILIGDTIEENDSLLINRAAYPKKIKSYNSWATDPNHFIKISLPDIDYSDGFFYDFTINIIDIPNITQQKEDSVFKLRFNGIVYPTSIKHFAQKIYGNNSKINTVRLMRDKNSIPCLVITLNSPINVYNIEVDNVSVFGSKIVNNYDGKDIITDLKITNEENITGYISIYDYTFDLSGSGIKSIQPGTNVSVDNSDPDNPIINVSSSSEGFNPFVNKKILLAGDSITAGYDTGIEKNIYPDFIKTKFSTNNVVKYGISGGTLASSSSWGIHILDDDRLSYIVSQVPDIIIIMGGINDYQTNMSVGDFSDYNHDNINDINRLTTVGSLAYALRYLMSNLPNTTILYCTSGQYFYSMSGSIHSGRVSNTKGKIVRDYFQACIDLCKQHGVPTLDFNAECAWLDTNETVGKYIWTTDGLHFSSKAYDKLTNMQFNKLKSIF